jgi:hypothetical protein
MTDIVISHATQRLPARHAPEILPPPTNGGKRDLAALAADIRTWHAAVGQAMGTALAHALAVGDALVAAKARVGHGQWLTWLKQECGLNERTAQRYLKIASAREQLAAIRHTVSDLSLRGALKRIKADSSSPPSAIKPSAHGRADAPLQARTHFLDGAGQRAIEEATPLAWREHKPTAPPPSDGLSDNVTKELRRAVGALHKAKKGGPDAKAGEHDARTALDAIDFYLATNGSLTPDVLTVVVTAAVSS